MKTAEDEAFDEIERRQGGGFHAKRAAAADKLLEDATRSCNNIDEQRALDALMRKAQPAHCQCTACKDGIIHASDCAVHNGPAYPAGPCDCGVEKEPIAYVTGTHNGRFVVAPLNPAMVLPVGMAFYTAPPKREWVGLTEDEWFNLKCKSVEDVWIALTVQAKLKEKNT